MRLLDKLRDAGVLAQVVVPPEVAALLGALELTEDQGALPEGVSTGRAKLEGDVSRSPLPGLDLGLSLPTEPVDPAPYKLELAPAAAPTRFSFWLVLSEQGQARVVLKPVRSLPGMVLTAAEVDTSGGFATLRPLPGRTPILVSRSPQPGAALGPALLISGSADAVASTCFTADTDSREGVIEFGLDPPAVLFGGSGVGVSIPSIGLDDSESEKVSGSGAPGLAEIDADKVAWKGLLMRQVDFYLPETVPLIGGRPIRGYAALPQSGPPDLVVETTVPAQEADGSRPARPEVKVRIECRDPTATGLSGLVPTLIAASVKLPDDPVAAPIGGGAVTFLRGRDLTLRATLARDPVNAPGDFRIMVAATADGDDGLVSVTSAGGLDPAKFFNVAAGLSTALIADGKANAQSDLATFAAAGAALSALFEDDSRFVLHGVEIASDGQDAPVGGPVSMAVDYSVTARVRKIGIDGLSVEMKLDMPMRIRVRGVRLAIDPRAGGAQMFDLDFERAAVEVENPGAWDVGDLARLFDVIGSRSGRGSGWIEVDLRFRPNLGPVDVSNLTLRATYDGNALGLEVRGMEAAVDVPGALAGSGSLHVLDTGFSAHLDVTVVPLRLGVGADVAHVDGRTLLALAVDLPAPIPLANSGFGLFGIGGLVAVPAVPRIAAEGDPAVAQLAWDPRAIDAYETRPGAMTLGFEAAVGTLPDFGFSLSAKARLVLSVPDVSVRGALNGRVLTVPARMTDPALPPPPPAFSFVGLVAVDGGSITYALVGRADVRPLLTVSVPIAGHYPFGANADDWHNYLGTDGAPDRNLGPVQARVLPGIFDIGADAYLMVRGRGISGWPHGRPLPRGPVKLDEGFVIAFGFGLQSTFGPRPVAWVELYASLDMLIGAKPPTLSGFGRAGGSLNLGPFSLGVEAQLAFFAQEHRSYLWCEVTGRIELLFFDIEGTVTISFGDSGEKPVLLAPDRHPLDRLTDNGAPGSTPVLTDDSYRVLAALVEDPGRAGEATVWPDAMISLPFAAMPVVDPGAGAQFPGVEAAPPAPLRLGTEMMWHEWHLGGLSLVEADPGDPFGAGTTVGQGAQLSARWQVGRVVDNDVCELLLFSTAGDLWVNRRSTSRGLPRDPLAVSAAVCGRVAEAVPGWAIGAGASPARDGFRLPPDPLSQSRLVSRVEAVLSHWTMGELWERLGRGPTVPDGHEIEIAVVEDWEAPHDLEGHEFRGHLAGPSISRVAEADPPVWLHAQAFALRLADPITDGVLLVALQRELLEAGADPEITASHEREAPPDGREMDETAPIRWDREDSFEEVADGWLLVRFRQPEGTEARVVRLVHPLAMAVAVIGVGGLTRTARDAAAAQTAAFRAEADALAAAAEEGVPMLHGLFGRHRRALLAPGRLYRLDVQMSWTGDLSAQDESGSPVASGTAVGAGEAAGLSYRRNGVETSTLRQLFFRTTAKGNGAALVPGRKDIAQYIHLRQDTFEPEMIERYLGGYEPAQSEMFRFPRDPLRVHFTQRHVNALADAYGFKLELAVHRTDRPGPEHAQPSILELAWTPALEPRFLGRIDRERFAAIAASPCAQPSPGATATAVADLATEAWYELYVRARPGDGRLPGVSFRTSRWLDPADMLGGLGFEGVAGAGAGERPVLLGDVEVATATAPEASSDAGLLAALAVLGLEGWPVPSVPRLSRLWLRRDEQTWLCAGLLVESVEPIIRAERLELVPLALDGGAADFALRRDSGGFRLLFLAAQPFPPTGAERFGFALQAPGGGATVRGTLAVPARPAFAEDPR